MVSNIYDIFIGPFHTPREADSNIILEPSHSNQVTTIFLLPLYTNNFLVRLILILFGIK
jgi:hypothetical protein